MKALGVIRRTDKLGRVVIPSEIRKRQGWAHDQALEMFVEGDYVLLRPYRGLNEHTKLITQLEEVKNFTDNYEAKEIFSKTIELLKKG